VRVCDKNQNQTTTQSNTTNDEILNTCSFFLVFFFSCVLFCLSSLIVKNTSTTMNVGPFANSTDFGTKTSVKTWTPSISSTKSNTQTTQQKHDKLPLERDFLCKCVWKEEGGSVKSEQLYLHHYREGRNKNTKQKTTRYTCKNRWPNLISWLFR